MPKQQPKAGSIGAWLVLISIAPLSLAQTPQATTLTVTGQVVDAVTGLALPRSLVRLGSRAMLTDPEGHFSFAAVDRSTLTITATKPGYSFTPTPNDAFQLTLKPESLAEPIALRLFPEAILKGTVVNTSGDPIPGIAVDALRSLNDDSGQRWVVTGVTRSNTHGQFRLPVPAGDYRLHAGYLRLSSSAAILPTTLPAGTGQQQGSSFHIHSGDQVELDIHPPTAPLVPVLARFDPISARELSGLTAVTADGASFPVAFEAFSDTEIRTALPAGRLTLQARQRNFGADGFEQASINVAPTAQTSAIEVHFAPVASIPVQVIIDDASASAASDAGQTLTSPDPRQLGLSLAAGDPLAATDARPVRPLQRRDGSVVLSAPPGAYRLRARANSGWHIVSADFGGTDILSHDLIVAPGAGSVALQIVVSNQSASLSGMVTLNGKPAACWVYLVASNPSATPLVTLHTSDDGVLTSANLPPGTYSAVALTHIAAPNPSDLHALDAFSTHVSSVTLIAGQKATLTLEAVPDTEVRP